MDRPIALLLLSVLLAISARAELQLAPTLVEREGDGVKVKQLAFPDGDKTVTYLPPHGWDYSGSATQLMLHPRGKAQAEATITRVPVSQPGRFDDESLKKLVDQAIAQIPKDTRNVIVISQEKNPVIINRKETFLVILGYQLSGHTYNQSVLFLNREKDQIRFQLVCREKDFNELQGAFLHSQFSWENL
jgi:hypothetical protein